MATITRNTAPECCGDTHGVNGEFYRGVSLPRLLLPVRPLRVLP